jgi:hypothetical protein
MLNFKLFFEQATYDVYYHGSPQIFNNFSSKAKIANDYGCYGYGFYFTQNEKTARIYGPNIYKCKLNLSNPLIWTESKESLWDHYDVIENNEDPENSKNKAQLLTSNIKKEGYNCIIVKTKEDNILEICMFYPNDIEIISKQIASNFMDSDEYS